MRTPIRALLPLILVAMGCVGVSMQSRAAAAEKKAVAILFHDGHSQNISLEDLSRIEFKSGLTLVFRDGRQQSVPLADISRIEFNAQRGESQFGRNYFLGKWEVGTGVGGSKFFIILEPNGQAKKTLGSIHGTWAFVDGEARITWDDGWHDAIRKVGSKHQKFAYEPGKTFSDSPSNVTDARNTTAEPI